eukprot:3916708-Rhodomonas_salina.1
MLKPATLAASGPHLSFFRKDLFWTAQMLIGCGRCMSNVYSRFTPGRLRALGTDLCSVQGLGGFSPAPRTNHTLTLVPKEFGSALLLFGGRSAKLTAFPSLSLPP